MIEILRASGADVGGGCTVGEVQLPAGFAPSGLSAVQFHHFAPESGVSSALPAGQCRLTAVVDGMLSYSDSLGHEDSILGGEVQLLQPAEQVTQTLRNDSGTDTLELVSLLTDAATPSKTRCVQRYFSDDARRGHLCVVASRDASGDALQWSPRFTVFLTSLDKEGSVILPIASGHRAMVCVMTGAVSMDGEQLPAGNCGVVPAGEPDLRIESRAPAELLVAVVPPTRE